MKEQIQLKWYHFLISWFLCLFVGFIIGIPIIASQGVGDEGILMSGLVTIVAMIVSAPFIILFCIIMHFAILKKQRSKSEIHLIVFVLHALGSIMVFFGILFFANIGSEGFYLIAVTFGYFLIDSIFFHLNIHKKAVSVNYEQTPDADLLDSVI